MFLNKTLAHRSFQAKIALEAAIAQRLVDEGRRELDAKRSMVRHVSHEIRYGLECGWCIEGCGMAWGVVWYAVTISPVFFSLVTVLYVLVALVVVFTIVATEHL